MTQAFYKRRRVQASQPQRDSKIDWLNPIGRGLIAAFLPSSPVELISGRPWVVSGTPTNIISKVGVGKKTNGSTDALYVNIGSRTLSQWTLFAIQVANSPLTDTRSLSLGNSASDTQIVALNTGATNAAKIRFFARDDEYSSHGGDSVDDFYDGVVRTIALTYVGSVLTAYRDGGIVESDTYPMGNFTINQFAVGALRRTGTAYFWSGSTFVALAFNRALPANEIASLINNPWKLFRAPDSRIWLPAAGGSILNVASLYTPADASSYQARVDLQQSISALQTVASASGFVVNVDLQRTLASIFTPASALGYVAGVNLTRNISAVLAQATAAGNTATVTLAGVLTIPATLATATASGANANVNLAYQFTASPATSAASGYQASVNLSGVLNITGSLSVATASGQTARIDRQYSIAADFAQAVASAAPAVVSFGGSGSFTPEQLAEILAYVEANMSVPTTADIAAAVLAALQATTIPVNTTQIAGHTIHGDGTTTEFYV